MYIMENQLEPIYGMLFEETFFKRKWSKITGRATGHGETEKATKEFQENDYFSLISTKKQNPDLFPRERFGFGFYQQLPTKTFFKCRFATLANP